MTRPEPSLDDQQRVRSLLRIGGWLALVAGLVLAALGLIDFFSSFGTLQMPTRFWMAFIGLPLMAIGGAMLRAGYLGPASRYVAGEVTPTIRDTLGALGVGSGRLTCPSCGGDNAPDARFCDDCGAPMRQTCPSCSGDNAPDARFCDDCGRELATPGAGARR